MNIFRSLFRSLNRAAIPALAALTILAVGVSYAGIYNFPFASSTASTANRTAATLPMTGDECVAGDTNLSGGRAPQTACYNQGNLKGNYAVALTDGATVSWPVADNANLYTLAISGARTVSAPTSAATGQLLRLALTQSVTSSTVTWPSTFRWTGNAATGIHTAPTLTVTQGRTDFLQFVYNGSVWIGSVIGQAYYLN